MASDLSARLHADKAALTVFLKSVITAQAAMTAYVVSKAGPASPFPQAGGTAPVAPTGGLLGAVGAVGSLLGAGGSATAGAGGATEVGVGAGEVPAAAAVPSAAESPAMKAEGMGQAEIARKLGCSKWTVYRALQGC